MAMTTDEIAAAKEMSWDDILSGIAESTKGADVRKAIYGGDYKAQTVVTTAETAAETATEAAKTVSDGFVALKYLSATVISSGDLNDYTSPGNFIVSTTTVSNMPVSSAGRLTVLTKSSAKQVMQIYAQQGTNGNVYWRGYSANSATWGDWKTVAVDGDVAANRRNFKNTTYDLWEYFLKPSSYTHNGITYDTNDDGTISVSGTSTKISWFNLVDSQTAIPDFVELGGTYRIEYSSTGSNVLFYALFYNSEGGESSYVKFGGNGVFTVPSDAAGIIMRLYVVSGVTVDETVTVHVYNDALQEIFPTGIEYPDINSGSSGYRGVTWSWSDGVCTINGTPDGTSTVGSADTLYYGDIPAEFVPGETYLVTCQSLNADNVAFEFYAYLDDGDYALEYINYGKVIQIPKNTKKIHLRLRVANGDTITNGKIWGIHFYRKFQYVLPRKKYVSVVDDDTSNIDYIQKFYKNCGYCGIVGNYAVQTSHLADEGVPEALLEYENEGFGMLLHCETQNASWQSGGRDDAARRADIVKAIRDMQSAGFVNYRYWVTPGGARDKFCERIARAYGFKCLVTANYRDFNRAEPATRWMIKREGLSEDSVAVAKGDIDTFVADDDDGWLVFVTHYNDVTADWTEGTGYAFFNEVINYAKEQGCEFVNFPEGFSYYEPFCID